MLCLSVRCADGKLRPTPWIFTTTGAGPFRALHDCKQRLDRKIAEQQASRSRRGLYTICVALRLAEWRGWESRSSSSRACLNHANTSVTSVYNRYEYLAEKRRALELWAQYLQSLTSPPGENVVALKRA